MGEDVEKREPSGTVGEPAADCKGVRAPWETVWRVLGKFKRDLPYDPAIPLLGISLKKNKTLLRKGLRSPVFAAALLTAAKSEAASVPLDGRVQEEAVVPLGNGILLGQEKE